MKAATLLRSIGCLLLVCFSIQLSYLGFKNFLRYYAFKEEYQALVSKKKIVEQQINYYETILAQSKLQKFWELEAKQRLGVSYTDETVYKIIMEK